MPHTLLREAGFSGTFYPSSPNNLSKSISEMLGYARIPDGIDSGSAYISPHAGYKYSGTVAARTYKAISQNKSIGKDTTFLIIGPNHIGLGSAVSVSMARWRTPIGDVENDTALSNEICKHSGIEQDEIAHVDEHSIEVQLPFLKSVAPGSKACFISMMEQEMETSVMLESAISEAAERLGREVVVIASSDFDHYEPEKTAQTKDMQVLRHIISMNPVEFNYDLKKLNDSICGYGPITVAMLFAKRNGCTKGEILYYANSGLVTGDKKSVVSYVSAVMR